MSTKTHSFSAEDLLLLQDDGFRYELIQGVIRRMTPAGFTHGKIAMRIAAHLLRHVDDQKLGVVCAAETGFKIAENPDTVRAPDVAFVRQERILHIGEPAGFWPGPPDLAIEILSPHDTYAEVNEKVMTWLEAGTLMVIVVNPRNRNLAVYRSLNEINLLTNNDVLQGADVVPGWSLPIALLFAD